MTRACDILADKEYQSGNNVSHSNRKTRRRFRVNLQNVSLESAALRRVFHLRVAASTLRSIDKNGGLDAFLRKTAHNKLTAEASKIKRAISNAADTAAAA